MELDPMFIKRVDAIENEHVNVDVQIQGRAKSLYQGDRTGTRTTGDLEPGTLRKIGLDGANDDGKTAAESIGLIGEKQAQGPGETQHPLPDRYRRNDMIDQVRSGLGKYLLVKGLIRN
jgi:hypothetical protein